MGRYVIYVKEGVYEEYMTITKQMSNVTMYGGDDAQKAVIMGNKNFTDGLTTCFKTAMFNASNHQAVALLVQSDRSIFLNGRMDAFHDTLYAYCKSVVLLQLRHLLGHRFHLTCVAVVCWTRPGRRSGVTWHDRGESTQGL
ncbi:hypothetical protein PR202_gb12741 [Eleusine coracana subsp. coracana]|uniref:Pectinesterase catalytic domain-containing protein n=1 Tax=Eleusine coracana subsp. coracana TaxID=191504 RepID=A0AAV5EQA1_ELECO|nr:hypothetical protein PR202_gb12741 [Eleusine coracana subsp. coracana]